jgi:DedD protein
MALWRRKDPAAEPRSKRSSSQAADQTPGRGEPADAVRVRARRRLIGAAALLLTAAIVVPMLLDPEPKPTADNIAIDIPSEKTPFTPRLTLPPVPAPDNVPVAPPQESAPIQEKAEDSTKAEAKKVEEQRARALLEGKSKTAAAAGTSDKTARFVVQAAAPASETAARDLAERLKKSGLAPYMEKVDTKQGVRYRVRLGPYATRDEADGVRARLKAQGISANLVTL